MPQSIKCPNCKAPLYLGPNQISALCDYCGHQAHQGARPKPRLDPPTAPIQGEVSDQSKRNVLIVMLVFVSLGLMILLSVPAIVRSLRRGSSAKQAHGTLSASALDSLPDQKLALAIDASVRCLNDFGDQLGDAQQRYLGWVDREAGPRCESRCAWYGIYRADYTVAACQRGLQQAAYAVASLRREGEALLVAAKKLKRLSARAHKYYDENDYLDDDCALGKRLHRPLVDAFDAFNRADRTIRAIIEQKLPPLIKRRQANLRKRDDAPARVMVSYYQVWLDMRDVVIASDQLASARRSGFDPKAVRALITKVGRLSVATLAAEKRLRSEVKKSKTYFLFPRTYEYHLHGHAERLVKVAKRHVRCMSDERHCDSITPALKKVHKAYNEFVTYGRGLGPRVRTIDESRHDNCF